MSFCAACRVIPGFNRAYLLDVSIFPDAGVLCIMSCVFDAILPENQFACATTYDMVMPHGESDFLCRQRVTNSHKSHNPPE